MVFHKDLTVVYYTGNQEEEPFEKKIQSRLLDVIGNTPLISVSQKPIDFGKNICVGDIGLSDMNIFRQLLIGCEAADTPYIATAEADCLYPATGYFDFNPPKTNMAYRYTPLWFFYRNKDFFYKKEYSLCAQISSREYIIPFIKRRIEKGFCDKKKDFLFNKSLWAKIPGKIPCLSIKSGRSMRPKTSYVKGTEPVKTLNHWGNISDIKRELWT